MHVPSLQQAAFHNCNQLCSTSGEFGYIYSEINTLRCIWMRLSGSPPLTCTNLLGISSCIQACMCGCYASSVHLNHRGNILRPCNCSKVTQTNWYIWAAWMHPDNWPCISMTGFQNWAILPKSEVHFVLFCMQTQMHSIQNVSTLLAEYDSGFMFMLMACYALNAYCCNEHHRPNKYLKEPVIFRLACYKIAWKISIIYCGPPQDEN